MASKAKVIEEPEAPEEQEPEPEPAHAAPAIPTREDIAAAIRERLDSGLITERDVLVDMYASQYAIELHLQSFRSQVESFSQSGLGRMLTRKAQKEARRHADQE